MPPPRTPAEGAIQVLSRQPSAGDPSPDEELPHVAFAALARALPLSPDDAALHAAAQEAAERADALESYVEVVSDLLGHFPARTRAFLHRTLAEVHEQKLGDREAAVRHFRAAVDAAPEDLEALAALRRLHVAGAEWAALADVLERVADAAPDASKKLTSWREAAVVHEQMLRDDESAAKCWHRIAEQEPNDRDAAHALERLYAAQDQPEGLAFALQLGRAQEGDSARGRDLTVRLAVLKAQRLGALAEAVALCREVAEADPTHSAALEALHSWAGEPTAEGSAALGALDSALLCSGDAAQRIALREERSLKVGQLERSQLAGEMMQIWDEELGQKPQAFMAGLKAFASGIERAALLPALTRLARETSSLEELAEVVEASAEALPSGHRDLPTFLHCAAMIREELAQYDAAKQLWNDLLAEACDDVDALDGLARLYERAGDARNLSEVYARKANAARDPQQRRAMMLKAAAAHEAMGEDDEAIEALRAALQLELNGEALVGLDRLLGKRGRFAEQAEVLLKLAGMSSNPELAQILHSRRGHSLEQAGDVAAAARAYAQALSISSDEEAIAGLERLLESAAAQSEAAFALEPLYRARQELRKLAAVLEIRIEATPRSEQAPILEELASTWETVGELHLAFTARLRSFGSDPQDARHRAELERLARQTGAIDDLIAAYQDQLDRGVSDALAVELWRTIATVSQGAPGHEDLALMACEEALRRYAGPGRAELLRTLADACRRSKAIGKLSEVLPQLIAAEPSREAQVDLLFELAQLAEDALGNKALAARSYRQILERMPRERSAFNSLARLLAENGEERALAALLQSGIRSAHEAGADEEVTQLEMRLGRLRLDRLGDHEGALAMFHSVLQRTPTHAEAVAALEEMAFGTGPCRTEAAQLLEPIFEEPGRQ
ncbi:MAG TPA: gliding motility protein, partial [Myxococcaceae bacterium]|nr:gliding motility protein [Myxococcaceae bacterium]